MKATKATRKVAEFVDVRRNDEGGTTYKCLKCGFTKEANAYYEADHKTMINHAAQCNGGQPTPPPLQDLVPIQDFEKFNEYIRQFAGHIKKCIPNGKDLSTDEAIGLARVSMASNLSPFTGEVWYIPKKGPHVGIRGLRRKAKEQALYSKSFRSMRSEEIEEHDIRPCDVGYVCELFRHDLTKEAAEINRLVGEAVIPIRPIVGIGIWRKRYEEIAQYKDDPVPHGKSPAWVAKKRAEADALSQAYDIGINMPYSDIPDYHFEVIDAEDAGWSVVADDEIMRRETALNAERRAQAAAPDFSNMVAKYKNGELELPPWVQEIRKKVEVHPQASDALAAGNGSFIKQLEISAGRKVSVEQFRAFVEIMLTHPLDDVTYGEAAVLMDVINADDFEAQVIGLLS